MKSLFLPFAAVAVCVSAVPAFADDAKDALLKSQQARLAAPMCRMTITSKEAGTGKTSVVVVETVNPSQTHVRQEQDGKVTMEMFTDGKRTMIRHGVNGPIIEAPANVSAMVAGIAKSGFLQEIAEGAQDVKVAGHEAVNGQAATIYTFSSDALGVHAHSKLWVSDKDALPLKAESDSTGSANLGASGGGEKASRHSEITFSYDPSITFSLPAVG